MQPEERLGSIATAGLVATAVGAFLPWARIGGRGRSGFNTADTFIGLADGALPDAIAWVGRWWYAPAVFTLLAWATVGFAGSRRLRLLGSVLVVSALAMWWLFVWAGHNWNVLDVRLLGPGVSTLGLVILGVCCTRPRRSLVSPKAESDGLLAERS